MWILFAIGGFVLILGIFLFVFLGRKKKQNRPAQNLLAELDSMMEKGLITEQEYNEKAAEITRRQGGKNE